MIFSQNTEDEVNKHRNVDNVDNIFLFFNHTHCTGFKLDPYSTDL